MTTTTGPNLQLGNPTQFPLSGNVYVFFATPYVGSLYIYELRLMSNPSVSTLQGKITKGTSPTHGGVSTIQVNPTLLASIITFLMTQSGIEVAVVYDDQTLVVSDVIFSALSSSRSVRASVVALDAHVGVGNVNAELKAIRQTLGEVVEALQNLAPPDSRSRGLSEEVQVEAGHRPSMAVPRSPKRRAK